MFTVELFLDEPQFTSGSIGCKADRVKILIPLKNKYYNWSFKFNWYGLQYLRSSLTNSR